MLFFCHLIAKYLTILSQFLFPITMPIFFYYLVTNFLPYYRKFSLFSHEFWTISCLVSHSSPFCDIFWTIHHTLLTISLHVLDHIVVHFWPLTISLRVFIAYVAYASSNILFQMQIYKSNHKDPSLYVQCVIFGINQVVQRKTNNFELIFFFYILADYYRAHRKSMLVILVYQVIIWKTTRKKKTQKKTIIFV